MISLKFIFAATLVLGVATAAILPLKTAEAKHYMGFGGPGLGYGQEYGQGYGGYGGYPGMNQGLVPPYYRGAYGEWPQYGYPQGGYQTGYYQQYPQYQQYPGFLQQGIPYNNYASSSRLGDTKQAIPTA